MVCTMNVENVVRPPQKPIPEISLPFAEKTKSCGIHQVAKEKLPEMFAIRVPCAPGNDRDKISLRAEPKNPPIKIYTNLLFSIFWFNSVAREIFCQALNISYHCFGFCQSQEIGETS